ncbi:MAG: DUF1178 family protein [Pseudomonadota bacterium]
MIKYALTCPGDHQFEAWFSNSNAYDDQRARGLVECPVCGSTEVSKQIMAPAVRPSGEKSGKSPTPEALAAKVAGEVRTHISENFEYVGGGFADQARAMYYGEQDQRPVWGETTPEDAKALREEGVPASPLPKPFAPTPPKDESKLN